MMSPLGSAGTCHDTRRADILTTVNTGGYTPTGARDFRGQLVEKLDSFTQWGIHHLGLSGLEFRGKATRFIYTLQIGIKVNTLTP